MGQKFRVSYSEQADMFVPNGLGRAFAKKIHRRRRRTWNKAVVVAEIATMAQETQEAIKEAQDLQDEWEWEMECEREYKYDRELGYVRHDLDSLRVEWQSNCHWQSLASRDVKAFEKLLSDSVHDSMPDSMPEIRRVVDSLDVARGNLRAAECEVESSHQLYMACLRAVGKADYRPLVESVFPMKKPKKLVIPKKKPKSPK